MKNGYLLIFLLGLINNTGFAQMLSLSTSSDSASYYYYKGWENVMDFGHYSNSAIAYQKCVAKDPNFLIGQCLYGRISSDLAEQEAIYNLIEKEKSTLKEAEYELLEVFHALLNLMIIRQKHPENSKQQLKKALKLGEENFRKIVHQYPDEIYYKAEYIEILHYNHGAQTALDSLAILATAKDKQNPFLLGYAAMMEAELGQYDTALSKAKQLATYFAHQEVPKPNVVFGDIYFKMGQLKLAKKHIDRALIIDPNCIDALRLLQRIKSAK